MHQENGHQDVRIEYNEYEEVLIFDTQLCNNSLHDVQRYCDAVAHIITPLT
jgi:hypothetical protein